jgi:hypothetical protein
MRSLMVARVLLTTPSQPKVGRVATPALNLGLLATEVKRRRTAAFHGRPHVAGFGIRLDDQVPDVSVAVPLDGAVGPCSDKLPVTLVVLEGGGASTE